MGTSSSKSSKPENVSTKAWNEAVKRAIHHLEVPYDWIQYETPLVPDNDEFPNSIDHHLANLLGYRDAYDMTMNATDEEYSKLDVLNADNPHAMTLYKAMLARAGLK
jgi:hypothetical protein